jgi:acylpyruvate hydrolase
MRLASFSAIDSNEIRIGAVFDEKETLIDLNAAYSLYLFEEQGEEQPGLVADGALPSDMITFLQMGSKGIERARKAIDHLRRKGGKKSTSDSAQRKILYQTTERRLKPPVPNPPAMFWLMFTFQDTLNEVGPKGVQVVPLRPTIPAWFFKPIQCLVGPDDYVIRPTGCEHLMQSAELGVVIGRRAFRLSQHEVRDYIAGYTICKDVTAIDFLPKEQLNWTMNRSKVFPTFAPIGPYIITTDEIPDPHKLVIEEYIDNDLKMSTATGRYETKVEEIVAHASQHIPLDSGTIISVGGPPACTDVNVRPGQTMVAKMKNLGTIRNPVISEEEAIAKGLLERPYYWPGEKDYQPYLNHPNVRQWVLKAVEQWPLITE